MALLLEESEKQLDTSYTHSLKTVKCEGLKPTTSTIVDYGMKELNVINLLH
jgi:hypothetical protein